MKILFKPYYFLPLLLVVWSIAACRKDRAVEAIGDLKAIDYTWNVALKGFQPEATVSGKLTANIDLKTVYYYIQRAGKQDSLIQLDFPGGKQEYTFSIKPELWPNIDLQGVKGIKVLAVQDNNTSLEKLVKITYFNPAAPVLSELPANLTPSLTGATAVTGKASSETGISKVYFYDNAHGNFEVLDSIAGGGNKAVTINYNYKYSEGAGQLKVMAVDIYGLKAEKLIQFVNIPFKPVITFAMAELQVALPDGKPAVSGTLKTYSALTTVEAYIVKVSGETLHGTVNPVLVSNTANEYNYTFNFTDFPFADEVTACKLVAKDGSGNNSGSVPVKVLPYYRWNNITMMSQGTASTNATSCFFVGKPGTPTLSACEVVNDASTHADIDFAIFTNSALNLAFNNPANISASTLSTFKCNGTSWTPATPTTSTLKKTVFRVLGSGVAETAVYNRYNDNTISDLGDAFFTGVSAPSANAPNTTTFDNTKLIWAKVTPAGGGTTKNILIKVQSINIVASPNQGTSTITIDILKEK
ncbi:hypothetical protein [Paraflavitalea sp. CAU 1676]|uniref:hypothetical protein n=1 Tax=Paraflavitalea sp. CAU 1676 TaxID=3032598 RepID=UPI0023D9908C|nr:hypothetical protein [Paraflavitalea sp. CAU 1676]MDF2192935.1 hypothetical protein [Paraflavitalea sp. CAU 1676]